MLEVIPPQRRASEKSVSKFINNYVLRASRQFEIDAFNIPEVVEENYRGEPFYRNMDPRMFAERLRDLCGD
ncbi:MAG: hypothetical protein ACE5JQ_14695, partial [Candidatus Methylomirabilales bacterium]